jgi:hypothetical protein
MDFGEGLIAVAALMIAFFSISFLWELTRRTYYWTAARVYGWSKEEKFRRQTAWLDREAARAERRAKKNEALARNVDRKRVGAYLCAFAVAALCWYLGVAPWHAALIVGAVYAGVVMAAGIALF